MDKRTLPKTEEWKNRMSLLKKGKPFCGISFDPTGIKHTEETKKKMSLSRLGHITSNETRIKIGLANKGKKSAMKGIPRSQEVRDKISKSNKGKKLSENTKRKISEVQKGKRLSNKTKLKISIGNIGRVISFETRKKIGDKQKGELNHNWKGGNSRTLNKIVRQSLEYKLWRDSCFARDGYTCQKTGIKGGNLVVHHIKNFSQYPELRFAIDNGITLSEKTHKEFHKKYGVKNNSREQLNEFIREISLITE